MAECLMDLSWRTDEMLVYELEHLFKSLYPARLLVLWSTVIDTFQSLFIVPEIAFYGMKGTIDRY